VSSSIGDGLGRGGGPGPCCLLRKVAPRADAKESRKWLSPGNYVVRDLPMLQSTNIAVDWQRRKIQEYERAGVSNWKEREEGLPLKAGRVDDGLGSSTHHASAGVFLRQSLQRVWQATTAIPVALSCAIVSHQAPSQGTRPTRR
jgi:hypothetical protein